MLADNRPDAGRIARRHLIEALIGFVAFCAISFMSLSVPLAIPFMVLCGVALPLAWGWMPGGWEFMGFTRKNMASAVYWGLAAGLSTSLLGFVSLPVRSLPSNLGLELAAGIPLWLLLASPFQEFFFRGWLQPRCESRLGKSLGLLAATAGFTAWHYCWPLASQSPFPLYALHGLAATFAAGLIYGYSFQRTGSIMTPWLAHAFSGITFLFAGAGSFLDAGMS